jgi:hypothetical protein
MKGENSRAIRFFAVLLAVSISLILFTRSASAQDLLLLKTGKEIKVNIVEEGADIIKYREFENPTGPLYSIARDKVAEIKYRKGAKEVPVAKPSLPVTENVPAVSEFKNSATPHLTVKRRFVYADEVMQSHRNVKLIMEDYPDALMLYETGKRQKTLSNSCAYGVILTSFITSSIANKKETREESNRVTAMGLGIDGAFIITAIVLSVTGKKNLQKSVSLYNSSSASPLAYKLNVGIQGNGIGLSVKF